jgi:hypothetical protein
MPTLLPTADLAVLYGVAPGTVRCWISQDRIAGRQSGRRKLYPLDDVQAAYDRRHPEPHTEQQ